MISRTKSQVKQEKEKREKKELKKEVITPVRRISYVIMSVLLIFTISSSSILSSFLVMVQAAEEDEGSVQEVEAINPVEEDNNLVKEHEPTQSSSSENQDDGSTEGGNLEERSSDEEEEPSSGDSDETSSSGCPEGQHYDSIEHVCVDDTQHSPQPLAEDEPVQRSNSNQQPPLSATSDGISRSEDNGLTQTPVVQPLTSSQTSGSIQPTPYQSTNEYFEYQHCKLLLGTGAGWSNVPLECWNLINKYESPQGYRCVDEGGISRSNIEDCLPHDSNGELCPPPVTQPCQSSSDNTDLSGGIKPWIGGAGYSGYYRGIPCVQDTEGTCLGAPFAPGGSASDCFYTPASVRDQLCGSGSGENDEDESGENDNSPCSEFTGSNYDLCMDNELDKILDGTQDQDPCKGQSYEDCLLTQEDYERQLDEALDDYLGDVCDPNLDANCYGPQTCDPAEDPFCYDRGYPDNPPAGRNTGGNENNGNSGNTGPCDPNNFDFASCSSPETDTYRPPFTAFQPTTLDKIVDHIWRLGQEVLVEIGIETLAPKGTAFPIGVGAGIILHPSELADGTLCHNNPNHPSCKPPQPRPAINWVCDFVTNTCQPAPHKP
jgi:hypothetical protein